MPDDISSGASESCSGNVAGGSSIEAFKMHTQAHIDARARTHARTHARAHTSTHTHTVIIEHTFSHYRNRTRAHCSAKRSTRLVGSASTSASSVLPAHTLRLLDRGHMLGRVHAGPGCIFRLTRLDASTIMPGCTFPNVRVVGFVVVLRMMPAIGTAKPKTDGRGGRMQHGAEIIATEGWEGGRGRRRGTYVYRSNRLVKRNHPAQTPYAHC